MASVKFENVVSINELRTLIPLISTELTVVVQSEPGCGKSSLLAMIAEDNGDAWRHPRDGHIETDKYDYIYVDCPVKDMQDIGMTIPDHASKQLRYYVSELFNLKSSKPKVILLDEMLKAPKLLQIIFTRLMLERMVGDEPLPEGSMLFAASNNASDGVGDTMLAHAGNRVCRVKMAKPTANEWLPWAAANKISRVVRAFVAMFPRCLASYTDPDQADNPYIFKPSSPALSFVSPRSLAKCDVIIRYKDKISENALRSALAGTIGEAAAGDMTAFVALEASLKDVKEIIQAPDTIEVPTDVSAQLMIMFQAVDVLDTQDELSRFMRFVERIGSSEIQAVFFTMMMRVPRAIRLARHNEQIRKWATDNHELFE